MRQNELTSSFLGILRLLGLITSTTVVILYIVYALLNPYNGEALIPEAYLLVLVLILLACVYAWASLRIKPLLMLIVSTISSLPVGIYLLLTPGIFRYIGIGNLICVVIAILAMFLVRRNWNDTKRS